MRWPQGAREAALALVVAAAAIVPLSALGLGPLRVLETNSLDLRFRWRGTEPPTGQIALLLVDDRSLQALGRWPLSRHVFAQAVRAVDRAGARLIVFDLLFAEPDQPLSADLRRRARAAAARLDNPQDETLRAALDRLAAEDPDRDLAAAIAESGKVLLPLAFAFDGAAQTEVPAFVAAQAYQELDQSPAAPLFPLEPRSVVTPVGTLAAAAAGFGHVNVAYDRDGAARYDYLALPFNGDFLPSLPVRAVAAYLGVPWNEVGLALGGGVRIGGVTVPTDPAMRLVVNYRGPRGTIPTYSFVDVIDGRIPAGALAGRIVLIGASSTGISDSGKAPFDNTPMPGTERLADIIDTILAQDWIRESPGPWPVRVIAVVVALAALAGAAIARARLAVAVVAAVAPLAAWIAFAQAAFDRGLWLPLVNPLLALAAAVFGVLLFRYGFVEGQRRYIQRAFRQYLAPELVNRLAANPRQLRLGGETRPITVMFSDIRGFTSISEAFKSNPEALGRLINRGFLTPMTRLIMARGGLIDKYMGDCIMAFWNAPVDDAEHADHACATALAMLHELDRINRQLEDEAAAEGHVFHPLRIGIGINTGDCVVGNMGSDERFAYTAMGDAVNLASRLESQTKIYQVGAILGEAVRAAAPSWAALELDRIAVRGKREPVRIYALLGDATLAASPTFRAWADCHDRMLSCFRAQDWAGARAALAEARAAGSDLAALYALYARRIALFEADPPGPGWNGVTTSETA